MQLSPNLPVSAHPELIEGLSVKKGASTMTQTTAISPSFPASQLATHGANTHPIPAKSHPKPYLHDRK